MFLDISPPEEEGNQIGKQGGGSWMRRESGRRMRGGGKEGGLGERSVRRDREKENGQKH